MALALIIYRIIAVNGCGAAIWCATGFSDAQGAGLLSKAKRLLGFAFRPKESIDAIGVPALAKAFLSSQIFTMASNQEHFPKVVMLSSAAV